MICELEGGKHSFFVVIDRLSTTLPRRKCGALISQHLWFSSHQGTRTGPPRICIASSFATTLTRVSDGLGALSFDKRILICRRVFNASTIRPSQNGSNACLPKNATSTQKSRKEKPF